MNLWDALLEDPVDGSRTLHCWSGNRFESAPWSEVNREALAMTRGMRAAGVRRGEVVATVLTNTTASVKGVMATWLAGGTLASFPVPARSMDLGEYASQIDALRKQVRPVAMFLDLAALEMLPEELCRAIGARSWESIAGSGAVDPDPPEEEGVAFVQYSSGSTSAPKGCALTTTAIASQLEIVMSMLEAVPGEEVAVSWLPLSHDMGIFGNLLTPWAFNEDLVLSSPERFMAAPRTWFRDIAEAGATVACGTNGALALAARSQHGRLAKPLRLHSLILGAERLQWPTLSAALDAFGASGLRPESLMPAYGLAEAVLAVTATPRGEPPRHLDLDGAALADGEVRPASEAGEARVQRIVASGVPCAGVGLHGVGERGLGELRVSSPSLASGYFGDAKRSRERFRDGEVLTRDLAFVAGGWLYPVGRSDDLISIGGRKVYACEIEEGVETLDGVRRGCSTLVETYEGGRQGLTLLVELADEAAVGDLDVLAAAAASLARARAAVTLDRCVFLERGALPKTPSGKIQRYRCRDMLTSGRFSATGRVELGPAAAAGSAADG